MFSTMRRTTVVLPDPVPPATPMTRVFEDAVTLLNVHPLAVGLLCTAGTAGIQGPGLADGQNRNSAAISLVGAGSRRHDFSHLDRSRSPESPPGSLPSR